MVTKVFFITHIMIAGMLLIFSILMGIYCDTTSTISLSVTSTYFFITLLQYGMSQSEWNASMTNTKDKSIHMYCIIEFILIFISFALFTYKYLTMLDLTTRIVMIFGGFCLLAAFHIRTIWSPKKLN